MLESLGLLGLFIACALSATVVPFSSEAVFTAALLTAHPRWLLVLVASAGNTAGGMVSFLMGWLVKWAWLEKWFHIKREKLDKLSAKVSRYGVWAALLTWLPLVGDPIAIAMGLMRTSPWKTALLMFVGKALRYAVIAGVINLAGIL
ncbi:MAG: DedA family protein [Bacteroidales bacterium]|jgi:membrane protein YqaA with SNARE-associated domain|nr:DedA family protein [Bacteroidales bacterium]